MTRIQTLLREFTHETNTTRRHLERLADAQFSWKPHPKSYSAGQLASHIVDCLRWVEPIFASDDLDFDTRPIKPSSLTTSAEVLTCFDSEVRSATRAIQACGDTNAEELWRLRMRGRIWFEKPREEVFRDMTLHHLIHHRGQFTVYLRLLNIPVPGSYGPTADDIK